MVTETRALVFFAPAPRDTHFRIGSEKLHSLPETNLTLRDLLKIFHRRLCSIIMTTSVVFFLAASAYPVTTWRYASTNIVQLQQSSSETLGATLNPATSLSEFEKKLVLVGAGLRHPVFPRCLRLEGTAGSIGLLWDEATSSIIPVQDNSNLYVVPDNPVLPCPSELVGSTRLRSLLEEWRDRYEQAIT